MSRIDSASTPMARGSAMYGRSMKASSDHYPEGFASNGTPHPIERRSGKQVKTFIFTCTAMYEDGTQADHVQQCTDGLLASGAEECLRTAHESLVMHSRPDLDFSEYTTTRTSTPGESTSHGSRRDEDLVQARTTRLESESYTVSRPTSARTPGSMNDWASEVDSPATQASSLPSIKRPAQLQCIKIGEATKVEEILARNLRTMQQLAVNRIAKAWIKGICPKKQAVFPYNTKKKREKEGTDHHPQDIPGWWPDTKLCKFIEPDHIKRDERINLCLHILRLRPSPAQVKKWNKGCVEPHPTHVTKGWTEFLKELASSAIFDETRESDGKTGERKILLAEIYDLAKREEEFQNGDIDADDKYFLRNETPSKPVSSKPIRRNRNASTHESDSESLPAPPSKRSKKTSVATTPADSPATTLPRGVASVESVQDCKPSVMRAPHQHFETMLEPPSRSASAASSQRDQYMQDSKISRLHRPMEENVQHTQCATSISQTDSFMVPPWTGTSPVMPTTFPVQAPMSTFPGRHDYQFPQQIPAQAPASSPYVEHQFARPPLENMAMNASYAPPSLASSAYVCQPQYNNAVYYDQPNNAQSSLFTGPCGADVNTHFAYGPTCVTDSTSYQYHPESGHSSYISSAPHYSYDTQAPARIMRGFTGHGSGVGGGAHT